MIVTLMTALLPTKGHGAMLNFMEELAKSTGTETRAILCSRSFEPISGFTRAMAFDTDVYLHMDDNAPQNPTTEDDWNYWRWVVESFTGSDGATVFVSSEPYGKKMAEVLGAQFFPFDINRSLFDMKGTDVRQNIFTRFDDIMPKMQQTLQRHVTIFGQESVGKTTHAKELARCFKTSWTHEFARPYLEFSDPTVTPLHMDNIVHGQYALQNVSKTVEKPIIFHDTDLLSTIGYYRICGIPMSDYVIEKFRETQSDLYLVLPDNIPFEPDILRYGGDRRESSLSFWTNLLDEFECSYYVLQKANQIDRLYESIDKIESMDWFRSIRDFVRD